MKETQVYQLMVGKRKSHDSNININITITHFIPDLSTDRRSEFSYQAYRGPATLTAYGYSPWIAAGKTYGGCRSDIAARALPLIFPPLSCSGAPSDSTCLE